MEYLNSKLNEYYGLDLTKEILETFKKSKPLTFRVNTSKRTIEEITAILDRENITYEKVNWYKDAVIIKDNTNIRDLDIYKNGEIYLQNLSSMIPPLVLNPKENETILDMAAAPGGKTLEMYNLSNGKALITACEKNKIRLDRLKYNIDKQGAKRISVLNKDAREIDEYFKFDKILLDAPCSGSGTLSNDDTHEVSETLLNKTTKMQKSMLEKAVKLLKSQGLIVYSTCSILKNENEDIVRPFIENGTLKIVSIDKSLYKDLPKLETNIDGSLCIKPTENFEGFFVIILKKTN